MASNRRQPFGYKIEYGKIVEASAEAEQIPNIFKQYLAGVSYSNIASMLQNQGIPYDGDKAWNKNMIARILADTRYIGENGFPALISEDIFASVTDKRNKKATVPQKTEEQKMLQKLCDGRVTKKVECEILKLINRLIAEPQKIHIPEKSMRDCPELQSLQSKLDTVMSEQPIDEDIAGRLIVAIAEAQYRSIGSEEYETIRLQRLLGQTSPQKELDAELLQRIILKVKIHDDGTLTVKLKNGQFVGKE